MAGMEDLLKGFDQRRVEEAMKRAKSLSENPQVQAAFSRVDKKELETMIRNLSQSDKNQLMRTFLQGQNRELVDLIQKLK